MKPLLPLAMALAILAVPARAADTSLPALMRLLPPPATGALQPGQVLLSYARVDLLAGARGPTGGPGATRAAAVGRVSAPGFDALPMHELAQWPTGSGFDFDAIEALLVLETGRMLNGTRVLAGARMPGLAALAGPLAPRGFAPRSIAGQPVLARGEDEASAPEHHAPGDALGDGIGLALRYAEPAPGVLLATRDDATLAAALGPARLTDLPELRALAQTAAGGPDPAQALVFVAALRSAPPIEPGTLEEMRRALAERMAEVDLLAGPTPWIFAMLSEARDAEGIVTRIAIPYRLRAAAEDAAAAIAARIPAMPPLPGLGPVRMLVVEDAAPGLFVAVVEARQPPGTWPTLFAAVGSRQRSRRDTPMTIGPVPRAAFAR
jgi:hypothetical protein